MQATLPFDVHGAQQPQYPSTAPTQRVGPPSPQQPQQSYSYSQQPQYAQPTTQAAPQYYSPATQVNVNRRRPAWIWLLPVLLGLCLLGGIGYALFRPQLPVVIGPTPTATAQGVVLATTTTTPKGATNTPGAASATPTPTVVATDTPVIVPTVTPEVPTDTPEPLPTDTPVPPTEIPVPPTETPAPPLGDYAATADADPREPKTPNGGMRITGTLYRGGQPVQGAAMRVTLHYAGRDDVIDGPVTGPDGTARISFKIGKAESGVQVDVDVAFFVDGQEAVAAQTSFTPKGKD